jgi:hypothetical protein
LIYSLLSVATCCECVESSFVDFGGIVAVDGRLGRGL